MKRRHYLYNQHSIASYCFSCFNVYFLLLNRNELGKSINTDEAAALGASYQAAHLSKGYKVKKFAIKDANIFPIQVIIPWLVSTDNYNGHPTKTVTLVLVDKVSLTTGQHYLMSVD